VRSLGAVVDPKIFITYSSKDEKVSRAICAALENRGLTCWISSRNVKPGQNYQEQIVRAIRTAKIMVLVFTANATNSNEIKKELALASQNNLLVIPVRIEDVTPNEAFAYEFATRQWIDLFDDWENSIARLVELIAAGIDDRAGDFREGALSEAIRRFDFQCRHLIEQPIDGICSSGPRPVSATCFIASNMSRRAFATGVIREASSLPRYCSSSSALKPKKSGVH
jgi:hypothetical protein